MIMCATVYACGSSTDAAETPDGGGGAQGPAPEAGSTSTFGGDGAATMGDAGDSPCTSLIDFETIPGATPSEGLPINTQFRAAFGVTFALENGNSPVLAKVGDPATAFSNDTLGVGDTAAPGQDIGSFFLTDDGMISGPPSALIITYQAPVAAAYAQIVDIDGEEAWVVEARDGSGAVIDSVKLAAGDPGTGDGIASPVSFKHAVADISSIRLRYTGSGASVGLAFDNFSPVCATLPVH